MKNNRFGHYVKAHEKYSSVWEVVLDRPAIHNAFNDEMIADLTQTFRELQARDDVRVVVLRAEGPSFCAGADLNWMKKMKDYSLEENERDSRALAGLFTTLNHLPQLVIGLMNGQALGGGVGLLACCDYVLAAEEAMLALTEVRLGLLPAVISPFVMKKMGLSAARAYFTTGARFSARQAEEKGLVHEVVPLNNLLEAYEKLLSDVLKSAPTAQRMAKTLAFEVDKRLYDDGPELLKEWTCETIAKVRVGAEAQEGMSALLDKRPAAWAKK